MIGHIYKLSDGLYHYPKGHGQGISECNKPMFTKSDILEIRTIGQTTNQTFKDPNKAECCLVCFPFMNYK